MYRRVKDEEFVWTLRSRLAALETVERAARILLEAEIIGEDDLDALSDALFTLDRDRRSW